ncbi:putative Late nodulin [Medicago truncatula]|uniref:Nodule Cysteine-Rich (NCR) secreted peptide n=1 Tax=Medicago truncatula TaxID=3880 RepID=A0A072UIM7_MEDTR|nr:Nodule Cysteine-Rich (NCR) secreted peptide [Medicago truncatula]RHN60161.1 putative Late nodulin [Medicago truncatula]
MVTTLKLLYVIILFIYVLFAIEGFGRFLLYNNCKQDVDCPNICSPHEHSKCILYVCYCVDK